MVMAVVPYCVEKGVQISALLVDAILMPGQGSSSLQLANALIAVYMVALLEREMQQKATLAGHPLQYHLMTSTSFFFDIMTALKTV